MTDTVMNYATYEILAVCTMSSNVVCLAEIPQISQITLSFPIQSLFSPHVITRWDRTHITHPHPLYTI